MRFRFLILFFLAFIFFIQTATSQNATQTPAANKFEPEILKFEQADQQNFPPKKAILFTGSSSIRLWEDLQERFPNRKVINRGFGGSGLSDLVYYVGRIVLPYKPRQIVIYSGENDIADGKTAHEVYMELANLVSIIRKKLPVARITYISMKPSPSRITLQDEIKKANFLIKDHLSKIKHTDYINIYDLMLGPDGSPKEELFVADRLHMNKAGYDIWTKAIKPYLVK
jgi:lysophospholipase L1-like esterase